MNVTKQKARRIAAAKAYLTRIARERSEHERKSDDIRAVINGTMSHAEYNAKHPKA